LSTCHLAGIAAHNSCCTGSPEKALKHCDLDLRPIRSDSCQCKRVTDWLSPKLPCDDEPGFCDLRAGSGKLHSDGRLAVSSL
jgi:hypothetical protein